MGCFEWKNARADGRQECKLTLRKLRFLTRNVISGIRMHVSYLHVLVLFVSLFLRRVWDAFQPWIAFRHGQLHSCRHYQRGIPSIWEYPSFILIQFLSSRWRRLLLAWVVGLLVEQMRRPRDRNNKLRMGAISLQKRDKNTKWNN